MSSDAEFKILRDTDFLTLFSLFCCRAPVPSSRVGGVGSSSAGPSTSYAPSLVKSGGSGEFKVSKIWLRLVTI